MMVSHMITELRRFIITFGLLICLFIIVGTQLSKDFKRDKFSLYEIVQDIFDAFNGKQRFAMFTQPQGQIFITLFVYVFNILLLSFLVAMFINRYTFLWRNLDALKRMNIIKLKNSSDYDRLYGGVTITFFPISIVVLPFIPFVVLFKSQRLNEFILKIQYSLMILLYCILAVLISIPLIPILYAKCVCNALYIAINNKRVDYQGQNLVQLVGTVLLSPFVIIFSLLVDLVSLPSLLLKDEKNFEFKY